MGTQLLLFLAIMIIPVCASIYCNSSYKKYKNVKTNCGTTGFEVARQILDKNGLNNIHIVETGGVMSDHYDPGRKVVRLSHEVFHGTSVASISIAAHEVGHALQDKNNYIFMRIRGFIFPIVNIASYIAYILIPVSFILSNMNLLWLSILLISFGVVFQLVTLPVEFDASKRAGKELNSMNLFTNAELLGSRTMLKSAALTYVAGLVASLLELLRLILIARSND